MARLGERMERSSGAAPSLQPGPLLAVHIEDRGRGASIVTLSGELDLSTIPRMESALMEQITQRRAVLVDLTSLSFIDSSGIGVLIQASRESNGTPLGIVIGRGSQVERVFGITGVDKAMRVYLDRDQALSTLGSS
jgi:anti-sigma B factor antagonist